MLSLVYLVRSYGPDMFYFEAPYFYYNFEMFLKGLWVGVDEKCTDTV